MYQWNACNNQTKTLSAFWPLYTIRWLSDRKIMAVKSFDLIAMIIDAKDFADFLYPKVKKGKLFLSMNLRRFLLFLPLSCLFSVGSHSIRLSVMK